MTVQLRFQKVWFQKLLKIAVFWWDVPLVEKSRVTPSGDDIPGDQRWRIRVFFLNAHGATQRSSQKITEIC